MRVAVCSATRPLLAGPSPADDPDELANTAASLPAATVAKLHATIAAIAACKTATECWTAQHM